MASEPEEREPAMEIRERLAANIRHMADERGVSLNVLADLSGYARSHFFEVMACRSSASVDFVWHVAQALSASPDALLRTDGELVD